MMGIRIMRLCDCEVSWLLQNGKIEGVETVELVFIGGLLRMGGESFLLSLWRSLGVGFIGKVELDAWAVRAVT